MNYTPRNNGSARIALSILLLACVFEPMGMGAQTGTTGAVPWQHPAIARWSQRPVSEATEAAHKGEGNAQYYLAWINWFGERQMTNRIQAIHWFEAAATNAVPEAQFKLGVFAQQGLGRSDSTEEAIRYYVMAADQGNVVAQHRLGLAATAGVIGGKSGADWLKLAAEKGYGPAIYDELVWREKSVHGVPQEESDRLILLAAEQGVAAAQYRLGIHLSGIRGGPPNLPVAYKWLALAQQGGSPNTEYYLKPERKIFSQNDRSVGAKLAGEFRPVVSNEQFPHWERLYFGTASGPIMGRSAESQDTDGLFQRALELSYESPRITENKVSTSKPSRQAQAVELLRTLAEGGHAGAAYFLAYHCLNGRGTVRDPAQAVNWMRRAAKQGDLEARYSMMEFAGLAEGYYWRRLAAAQGHERAKGWIASFTATNFSGISASVGRNEIDQRAQPPVADRALRLAVVASSGELEPAADLLGITIASRPGIEMVERQEIKRILREQGVAAAQNTGRLKLGKLLSADGILIIDRLSRNGREVLELQMMAVQPGVVISKTDYPWSATNLAVWASFAADQQSAFFPKLKIRKDSALPVSLVGFRSPVITPDTIALDRQVSELFGRQLLACPEIFVLERNRMEHLSLEQQLQAGNESFWNGAVVIEGLINPESIAAGRLKVRCRITPAQEAPMEVEVEGESKAMPELIARLTTAVVEKLGGRLDLSAWDPVAEALRYREEAYQQLQWRYGPEAQRAAEAAWALGLRMPDMGLLRVQVFSAFLPEAFPELINGVPTMKMQPELIFYCRRALENFLECNSVKSLAAPEVRSQGEALLRLASLQLMHGSLTLKRDGFSGEDFKPVREMVRRLVALLEAHQPMPVLDPLKDGKIPAPHPYGSLVVNYGGLWEETYADGLRQIERGVRAGMYLPLINAPYGMIAPCELRTAAWTEEDPLECEEEWYAMLDRLERDASKQTRLSGQFMRLTTAKSYYEFEEAYQRLWSYLKANAKMLTSGELPIEVAGWLRFHPTLVHGHFSSISTLIDSCRSDYEPWARERKKLQELEKEKQAAKARMSESLEREKKQSAKNVAVERHYQSVLTRLQLAANNSEAIVQTQADEMKGDFTLQQAEELLKAVIAYEKAAPRGTLRLLSLRSSIRQAFRRAGQPVPPEALLLPNVKAPTPSFDPVPIGAESPSISSPAHLVEVRLPEPAPAVPALPPGRTAQFARLKNWKLLDGELWVESWIDFSEHQPNGSSAQYMQRSLMKIPAGDSAARVTYFSQRLPSDLRWQNERIIRPVDQLGGGPLRHQNRLYWMLDGELCEGIAPGFWEPVGVDVPDAARWTEVAGRLLAVTDESLLELIPRTKEIKVLATSRQKGNQPFLQNAGDLSSALLSSGPSAAIRIAIGDGVFELPDGGGEGKRILSLPSQLSRRGASTSGFILQYANPHQQRTLYALRPDANALEVLLTPERSDPFMPSQGPIVARWRWPSIAGADINYPVAEAPDGDGLWLLLGPFSLYTPNDASIDDHYLLAWYSSGTREPAILKLHFPEGMQKSAPPRMDLMVDDKYVVLVIPKEAQVIVLDKQNLLKSIALEKQKQAVLIEKRKEKLVQMFDANKNGKLDPIEEALMKRSERMRESFR